MPKIRSFASARGLRGFFSSIEPTFPFAFLYKRGAPSTVPPPGGRNSGGSNVECGLREVFLAEILPADRRRGIVYLCPQQFGDILAAAGIDKLCPYRLLHPQLPCLPSRTQQGVGAELSSLHIAFPFGRRPSVSSLHTPHYTLHSTPSPYPLPPLFPRRQTTTTSLLPRH